MGARRGPILLLFCTCPEARKRATMRDLMRGLYMKPGRMRMRKLYMEPAMARLGTLRELTQNGGLANSDVPLGPASTAHCSNVDCPGQGVLS